MISAFDNIVGEYLSVFGEWEITQLEIIKELIPSGPDVLYLDIGGNIGAWTVPLATHANNGSVIAFEATREVSYYLSANIALNGLQNVQVINAVIGERVGDQPTITLTLEDKIFEKNEDSFAKFSVGSLDRILLKHPNSIKTVPTPGVILDKFYLEKLKRCPDFIKMDIENHEFYALRGARRMLSECQPILLIEMACFHLNKSIILMLDKLGYSMSWLFAPLVDPAFNFEGTEILNKLFVLTG